MSCGEPSWWKYTMGYPLKLDQRCCPYIRPEKEISGKIGEWRSSKEIHQSEINAIKDLLEQLKDVKCPLASDPYPIYQAIGKVKMIIDRLEWGEGTGLNRQPSVPQTDALTN